MRIFAVLLLAAVGLIHARADEPTPIDDPYDREFLKENHVEPDAAGLLTFLRKGTLTEAKIKRIRELIPQLGHPRFPLRDKANKELSEFGISVLSYLDAASRDADPEIAERARRLINEIVSGPGSSLPIAALRELKKAAAKEAVPVILDYLPFADDQSVVDEALQTLMKIGIGNGKPDARIRAYKDDPNGRRRAAVGFLLGRSAAKDDQAIAKTLLTDKDPMVVLRSAEGLIAGGNKDAAPYLIKLLHPNREEATWRAEELLRRLAGENGVNPPADDKLESMQRYQNAWTAWWQLSGKNVDLAKLANEPPVLGLWVGIEYNTNCVWECGRDGKRRWTIQAEGPMDAQILSANRILIAEQTPKRITERDLKGNILWQFDAKEEAINCQRLTNGNTFIATRHSVLEARPDKTVVFEQKFSDAYLHAARRMPNGNIVAITGSGEIHEMGSTGKIIRRVKLAQEGTWGDVTAIPGNRYLVSNYGTGTVREVDAGGKALREVKVFDACGLDFLPNGQLLVSGQSFAKIIDWTGKSTWEIKSNGCVRRIHRR